MTGYRTSIGIVIGLVLSLASSSYGQTAGEFEVRFNTSALTAQQLTALEPSLDASASFWESIISGYQPGVTLNGIDLAVSVSEIDGTNGILAQAGPSGFGITQGGFTFSTDMSGTSQVGTVEIDAADFNTELIIDVLNHEVAHTLGFVTSVINANGLAPTAGQYIGTEGLAAYQAEFDSTATFVPLTLDNNHLPENDSLTDAFGRVLGNELLSPIVENTTNFNDPTSNFLSNTSAGILRDLGFVAVAPAAVPEPSTLAVLALAGMALAATRRR